MSTQFDSAVSEQRRRVPWFCHASVLNWMKRHAEESDREDNAILTVAYRHSVASRFWYGLEFTDEAGTRRTVTAQELDLLTWRAEVANTYKHPYFEENKVPRRRFWRFNLFGLRIVIER